MFIENKFNFSIQFWKTLFFNFQKENFANVNYDFAD